MSQDRTTALQPGQQRDKNKKNNNKRAGKARSDQEERPVFVGRYGVKEWAYSGNKGLSMVTARTLGEVVRDQ